MPHVHPQPLHIESYRELVEHEPEVIRRIGELPNGGNLFMANPLRALADAGVALSPSARAELIAQQPSFEQASHVAYDAIRASRQPQPVRFQLKSLFTRRPQ
jgi:hypothetical protein